uniref:Uncharacterized protein n=1 Tax=Anguilla anguilla TaxID=7936 RepID=A0A0E9XD36_ANGAN
MLCAVIGVVLFYIQVTASSLPYRPSASCYISRVHFHDVSVPSVLIRTKLALVFI